MTPVKTKLDCEVPKCNKTLKNQKNLTSHMEKVHKVVSAITQSPLANTVRTLFSGESVSAPSTQTNKEVTEHIQIHDDAIAAAENDTILENDEEVEQEIVAE